MSIKFNVVYVLRAFNFENLAQKIVSSKSCQSVTNNRHETFTYNQLEISICDCLLVQNEGD